MAISNLLQPNPKLPNIINSFAPKKVVPSFAPGPQSLIPAPKTTAVTSSPTVSTPSTGGAGSYKGVSLSGTDAQIAEQMRKIDNPAAVSPSTATAPVSNTPPITTSPTTQPPQVKGLFPDVLSSIVAAGKSSQQIQNEANATIQKYREDLQNGTSGIQKTPHTLNYGVGLINALSSNEAAKETSVAQKEAADVAALGTNINALQGVAGLAAPRSADLLVDPTTGQPIGDINNLGSSLANWASIRAGANTAGNFTADYQTGLANLRAADTIGQQIISTLQSNPTLNSQPLSAITNIKAFLAGQASDPAQQLLSQQIANYIKTLGIDPNTINLSGQEQSTLGQLLDSLRQTAAAQIESKNPQNIINNPTGTVSQNAGGSIQAGGYNFKQDTSGNWVAI